jgi:putative FmdB family regulatory protein
VQEADFMPIYEYECDNCGHQLETIQKISDPPLTTCPECGQVSLRKRVSAAAFRLKGAGWYETDFKSGNKRNVAEGGDGKAEASEAGKESAQGKESGQGKASKQAEESKQVKEAGQKKVSSAAVTTATEK